MSEVQKKFLISWRNNDKEDFKSIVALVLDNEVFEEENLLESMRTDLVNAYGVDNVVIEEQVVEDVDQTIVN